MGIPGSVRRHGQEIRVELLDMEDLVVPGHLRMDIGGNDRNALRDERVHQLL